MVKYLNRNNSQENNRGSVKVLTHLSFTEPKMIVGFDVLVVNECFKFLSCSESHQRCLNITFQMGHFFQVGQLYCLETSEAGYLVICYLLSQKNGYCCYTAAKT
jgi:hypothetical protein